LFFVSLPSSLLLSVFALSLSLPLLLDDAVLPLLVLPDRAAASRPDAFTPAPEF
jgi:hypothetical protein